MDYIQRNNVDLKGWRSLIMNRCSIIFGGTGFIGTFFAQEVLSKNLVEKVYLAKMVLIKIHLVWKREFKIY